LIAGFHGVAGGVFERAENAHFEVVGGVFHG
jgi:hypothetical protein